MSQDEERKWLTEIQASNKYSIPRQTWANWRYLNKGPVFYKVGRSIRYREADVEAFMEQHRIPCSEGGQKL